MATPLKLTKARIALLIDQPFFGSILLRMQCVETLQIETMGVDGVSLFYNPKFLDEIAFDELKGVLAHEALHIACLHHIRQGARDHNGFNIASDLAINGSIEDAGLKLPKGRLRDKAYDGKSAEEIYSLLPPGGGQGKGQGNGQGGGQSSNGGQPQSNQGQPQTNFGGCGQVMPFPNNSPSAMAEQEQQVKIAVAQAAQYAKSCGKLPGRLSSLIGDLLAPKVDWKECLTRFYQQVARNDYTFKRPNPRYIATGFYLPTLYNETLGNVVFVLDTSGSITDKELVEGASELQGILASFPGAKVTVVCCDAQVQHVDEYEGDDMVKLTAYGRGGTDFRPPFDWVEKNKDEQPACLIYMTDGCCSSFPDPPAYPVMWLTTMDFKPPFGEIIPLREKFAA